MIRIVYCLCGNGTTPYDQIKQVVGNPNVFMDLGKYMRKNHTHNNHTSDWRYGEINADHSTYAQALIDGLTEWNLDVLTDTEAITWASEVCPNGTVIHPKQTYGESVIEIPNGPVTTPIIEES